ncbi:hypothetical protein [Phenylobacterium montanum]|uniref:Uncharacterized protein n=1 Tax=Phenylobacterium montanum TaxID=2823693 RepID=A0A975IVY9_9CAUL|nr:hypothetical protein [Caulobacter sp. S6]QUD89280.1 hypothetical protein KCG34_05215 [Caulobacter sp. S6]
MTAIAEPLPSFSGRDDRGFFVRGAIIMAVTVAAGFTFNLAAGRSSFGAPLLIHAHAITFMGWVTIYLTQNILVAKGNFALHRRLGWLAACWVGLMLVLGCAVTIFDIRAARVPFFFRPAQFLVFDPLTLFAFAGLTYAAIAMRRRTDWHRRLHFCAMSMMMGPAFGRLLPSPLLAPWAWEAAFAACLIFPLAGIVLDIRRGGKAHPAWLLGLAVTFGVLIGTEAITYSPAATALYNAVAAGSTGAAVAPLAFGHPPGAKPAPR